MTDFERDLELVEYQIASENYDWFDFRCQVAKELYVVTVRQYPDAVSGAKGAIQLADILIEELKTIANGAK